MSLVKDTAVKIASCLSSESVLNLCLVNKKFYGWIWENFDFWKVRLLKDFGFHYDYVRDIGIITFYYKTLYSVITKEKDINLKGLTYYPDLQEFVRNMLLSGKCEYFFTRGMQSGTKCGQSAKRYHSQYFCNQCVKKAVVKMQIEENEKLFNIRKKNMKFH